MLRYMEAYGGYATDNWKGSAQVKILKIKFLGIQDHVHGTISLI